jgi:hypothetical protein
MLVPFGKQTQFVNLLTITLLVEAFGLFNKIELSKGG